MKIKEYIDFSENVISELQELSEIKKLYYTDMLDKIKKRKDNPYLNIALIGDFSSGKSTFINAFIQKKILKTAWLATTAIPTHIMYHDKSGIKIMAEGMDGMIFRVDNPIERRLLERTLGTQLPEKTEDIITVLSTTNDFCNKIKSLMLCISSFPSLKKICIIDTPGVNPGASNTKEHVETTRNVLSEYADATIILFQAQHVYTNSFQTFLQENAGRFMSDAVFVITMLDLVEEEERTEIIEFVRRNLKEKFHLANPLVFGCSAKYALEESINNQEKRHWYMGFSKLRADVIRYMNERRGEIIHSQIQLLLGQLMEELDMEVRQSLAAVEEQLEVLERNSIEHLNDELKRNDKVLYSKL